jgi:hypothetical protein
VIIERAYQALLRLYPADYKVLFADDMLDTFGKAAEECRARGRLRFVRFAFAELASLVIGAVNEWIAKLTTDRSVRGRRLPDLRMMRPPGVPGRLWFAGARTGLSKGCMQDEVVEAEKRIDIIIDHMVHAIANHDFPKARFYWGQEHAAREHLRRLREMHNIHRCPATMPPLG